MNIIDSSLDRVKTLLILILVLLLGLLTYQITSEVKSASDDVLAQATLRKISDSLENYRQSHGIYPRHIDQILIDEYPYKLAAYFQGVHHGFRYSYDIAEEQYTVSARPENQDAGAGVTYQIQTGGELFAVNPL